MNKKTKIFVVFYFLVVALILIKVDNIGSIARTTLEYVKCGNSHGIPKPIPQLTTIAFTFLLVVTPILLIAFSIITLIKAISSSNAEEIGKAKTKLLKKLIISAIIFLVSFLVQFIVNRVITNSSDKNTFAKCMSCFLYYSDTNCPVDSSGSGNGVTSNTTTPPDKHNNRGSNRNSNGNNENGNNNVVNSDPGLKTGTYGSGNKYALYVPESVDSNKPLIVFLHGRYERGNNLSLLAGDAGFYASIQQGKKFNYYILMPQISVNELWNNSGTMSNVKALIDKVVQDYGIDKNRISLWGFSLGANEAPSYIQAYPDYFASNVLISCAVNPDNPTYYKNVPTYIFIGKQDSHGQPGAAFANGINSAGGNAKTKTYDNQDHSYFVTRVINDTSLDSDYSTIFDWMLAQRKN